MAWDGPLATGVQLWVLGYTLGGDVFSASGESVLCLHFGGTAMGAGVQPWRCRVLSPRVLKTSGISGEQPIQNS